ncbi:MAG: quinol:electron acceptor oxidoreductase subunit ActD [Acidobacteriota bacterium]
MTGGERMVTAETAAEPGGRAFAVLGLFETAEDILAAAQGLRDKGLGRLEAYTPYPVHGLDAALGHRRSPLAGMVLVMGFIGAVSAFLFQMWATGIDYPIVVGGKAPMAWQAFIPILFEVMVLFATFTAGLGMLLLMNRLPFYGHPILSSASIGKITRDRFALSLEAYGGAFDAREARAALEEAGATEVEILPAPEPSGPWSANYLLKGFFAVGAACLVAGYATYWAVKLFPVLPPMVHMEDQPKLDPQEPSALFRDGRGMQSPPSGTVARGFLPYSPAAPEEAAGLANPLPRTEPVLDRGQKAYRTHCAVCHGVLGDGVPTLTASYGAKPANLQARAIRELSDGKIYDAIVRGKNAMPSYAPHLSVEDRWSVVHYVRVLQRAQNATDADLERGGRP